jgi:hypothetical protein
MDDPVARPAHFRGESAMPLRSSMPLTRDFDTD